MNDLNTAIDNAAMRWLNLVEDNRRAAADIPAAAEARIGRMQGPDAKAVARLRSAAAGDAARAAARAAAYLSLAEGAAEGRFDVPRGLLADREFMRENQALIGQASQAGRYRVVDDD